MLILDKNIIDNLNIFIESLFPDFETCYSYYHDYSLDNLDTFSKMLIDEKRRNREKIAYFNFLEYINEDLINYIKTEFLKDKPANSRILLFNTFTQKVLNSILDNEQKLRNNKDLFQEIINKEKQEFLNLIKILPNKNNYYFEPAYFNFDKVLENKMLWEEIEIYSINPITQSAVLKFSASNFDIREYFEKTSILNKVFALMFDKNIKFELLGDEYSKHLENYGCKSELIHSFNFNYIADLTYKNSFLKLSAIEIDAHNFNDIAYFINLYINLLNNLPKEDYKSISLDFYIDSIEKSNAARVTYLIIALEALFNVNKIEIKRTITQRCCKILQPYFNIEELKQIEDDLNEAYNIRSEYAHGKNKISSKADFDFVQRISQYTRFSIVILLQLANNKFQTKKKERKFINEDLIDKSLLYKKNDDLLLKYLENVKIYKDVPIKNLDSIIKELQTNNVEPVH